MQILLHCDPDSHGSQAMADHVESVVKNALGRFGERVTRVEVHLSDADGQTKTGGDSIQCMLEARLAGLEAVVVHERADDAHRAIEGGMRKLKRSVGAAIAKHDPRHHRAQPVSPDDGANVDVHLL